MRNAERFLSQGKIRAAISEYEKVVENDPRDYSTLNTLGDLYVKNNEADEAVACYTKVANISASRVSRKKPLPFTTKSRV